MLPQDALLVPLSLEEALMVQSVLVLAPRLPSMFYFDVLFHYKGVHRDYN